MVFDVLGALFILGVIARTGITILVIANGQVAAAEMPQFLLMYAGSLAIGIPLAIVYLMGGSAMIRRKGLSAARTAAIVGCIPCFNCIVLTPIGIWAAVLVFSDKARQDFSD